MNAPAPLGDPRRSAAAGPPRQRQHVLLAALLGGLRFAAMAVVGVLGVWLLVLLFG